MFPVYYLYSILFILLYVLYRLKNYFQYVSVIKEIPGPTPHAIIGNVAEMLDSCENLFLNLRNWARDYYPAYAFLSHPIVSVNIVGPDDIENLIATMKHSQKSIIYDFLRLWLGEGLLTSFGTKWQQRRKLLTPTFHFNVLQEFLIIFNRETKRLVENFKKEINADAFDIIPYITKFTLRSINESAMGISLNFDNEPDKRYKNALLDFGKLLVHRISSPWLYFSSIYYITPFGFKEKNIVQILHNFTNKIIDKKIKNGIKKIDDTKNGDLVRKRTAMLDLLLNEKNEEQIDLQGIRDEINTFMFEGHDTISMALSFSLMLLAGHRNIQEQIVTEINEIIPDKNQILTYQNLHDLKFLERCIKECLRLYPSVPLISRVTDHDLVLSTGKLVPTGTLVNVHIYDLHRNPILYPEPEKFDPDRFLPQNIQNRHPFAYLPFSAGPRNCIGQKFAMLEMKVALCGILRNFILEPIDTPDTITMILDMVLRPKNGIKVKFCPRI